MAQANPVLTAIPTTRREPAPPRPQRQHRQALKALRRQSGAAIAIGAVGVTLVTFSLNPLAHGIELVTGAAPWEAWAWRSVSTSALSPLRPRNWQPQATSSGSKSP